MKRAFHDHFQCELIEAQHFFIFATIEESATAEHYYAARTLKSSAPLPVGVAASASRIICRSLA